MAKKPLKKATVYHERRKPKPLEVKKKARRKRIKDSDAKSINSGGKGTGKTVSAIKEMWLNLLKNDTDSGKLDAMIFTSMQNQQIPVSSPPFQTGYWEYARPATDIYGNPKKKTAEDLKKEEERALKQMIGNLGKLVAVVEWCIKGDVKIGVLFLKNNGAYELRDYNGVAIAHGSPGAMKNPMPKKLKIIHTIYNAEAEERKRKEPKPEDDLYDIEILD